VHEGLRYRADIDGLRAVAVLAVMLFHARLGVVPGGYVGVDIFFVISGFLISSIIVDGLKQSTFSMAQFYDRRVRRIFPALFTVMAACMAAGWIYLTPADYKNFAISVTSTAVFLSNVSFNRKAGYFAPAASTQPLLHTWSLGVEEQFYAIVPFVLILLYRHAWRTRAPIILGAALLSLGYAAYGVDHEWTSAFYLLPSRAWELLTGMAIAAGIVPAIKWRPAREAAGLTGLAMIAAACLLYTSETHFPGLAALLPCVGTALLIHSGNGNSALPPTAVSRLLSLPALVFTGKISYSLYLWHWPLLAFAEYNWPEAFNTPLRLGLIALAVVLSVLTWRFVEQPARQKSLPSARRRVFLSGGAAIAAALVTGYAIRLSDGVINRLPPEAREFVHNNPVKIHDEGICQLKEAPGTSET
jgi:peptidoglycan/LPS O-acetylase OafA/YrhL